MYYVKATFDFLRKTFLVGPCYGLGQQQYMHSQISKNINGYRSSQVFLEDTEEKEPKSEALSLKEFLEKMDVLKGQNFQLAGTEFRSVTTKHDDVIE